MSKMCVYVCVGVCVCGCVCVCVWMCVHLFLDRNMQDGVTNCLAGGCRVDVQIVCDSIFVCLSEMAEEYGRTHCT